MPNKLLLSEFHSPFRKIVLYGTGILCLLFFGIYLWIDDPLWVGFLRLAAFASFAGFIISYLNDRPSRKKIRMVCSDSQLLVYYLEDKEELKEEVFERDEISQVIQTPQTISFLNNIGSNAYGYTITFTDTDKKLDLFTYAGQELYFDSHNAKALSNFLHEHSIKYVPAD